MKAKVYTLLFSSLLCVSALADNEPWQNPQINEINREPMHAHFIPFTNEANALKQRSLPADVRFDVNPATERRVSLDGTWKFLFSKNNDLCPKDFHKYFGTDPKNKEKAIRLVYKELAKLREVKLTATQLAAAKKQVIGQLGVSGDNREGLFLGLGKSFLHYNRYDTLPEVFAKVEKLTAGEIREVANEIFAPERLFSLIYQ